MRPIVRDLYKRIILVGRDYPGGLDTVRRKAKEAIYANAELTDELEIKKAVNWGRSSVRDMIGVIQMKKYRSMKSRYGGENE
mmetsp:Transcript_14723/g.22207  ORF Transcript_14723/g.22207 Transcript_14723/m.22207 type:complete len:82 (-) Transcript_14723:263-508(-)